MIKCSDLINLDLVIADSAALHLLLCLSDSALHQHYTLIRESSHPLHHELRDLSIFKRDQPLDRVDSLAEDQKDHFVANCARSLYASSEVYRLADFVGKFSDLAPWTIRAFLRLIERKLAIILLCVILYKWVRRLLVVNSDLAQTHIFPFCPRFSLLFFLLLPLPL